MQPGEVMISTPNGDQCLQAATVIWTAGVRPSHLGRNLTDSIGCELDKGGGESLWNQTSPLPAIPKSESLETSAPIGTQPIRTPSLAWQAQLRKQADLWAKTSLQY
ncbi:hypothetical protein PMIT1327_02051 [Prochlorococcus marinus str. MIT 1327]|nr:hypothetical protein PMIT1312_01724 [Prochlorococcus marinus str. MIT 1312]KZR78849.1 hypothetical protein PMIT1327_02051 [Prochlorococcus marinus str. MIT 1327]